MARSLKVVVVLVLLALLPLRALAAVTIGFCAVGDEGAAVQVQAGHVHGSPHHHGVAPEPQSDTSPGCNVCAEHCTSASFVVPVALTALPLSTSSERIPHGEQLAAGFIPEHLDPPPLAL
jgi:hypothetical protein